MKSVVRCSVKNSCI